MTAATPSKSQFRSESLRRAELYRWFAGLLADQLEPVLLRAYRHGPGRAVLDNLAADARLAPGARRMEAALDQNRPDKELAGALADDFRALFIKGAASPRASAWEHQPADAPGAATTERPHKADILGRMKALLRHSGLGMRSSLPSDPDHVAVLLDVMAQTAEKAMSLSREASLPDGSNDTPVSDVPTLVESCLDQIAFIDDNLMPWLPKFRDACAAHDPDGFYAGVAILLVSYMERDRAFLSRCLGADG